MGKRAAAIAGLAEWAPQRKWNRPMFSMEAAAELAAEALADAGIEKDEVDGLVMGPVFEELQAKYDRLPVLYVTFEQTREFGRRQSRYLADAMGLNDTWAENGGKTGFVLLIDARSKRIVNRLSHKQTLKQMGAALQAAVESTS